MPANPLGGRIKPCFAGMARSYRTRELVHIHAARRAGFNIPDGNGRPVITFRANDSRHESA